MSSFLDDLWIPDFLQPYFIDELQRLIIYALIYTLIAMVQAYTLKTRLHIKKPKNIVNMALWFLIGILILRTKGIPDIARAIVILSYVATEILAYRLFHINEAMIYVIESEKQNIIVEREVFYLKGKELCVALQDNTSTLKRILLGRHVLVKVNAITKWTEDYREQLWLCNSYEIVEERISEIEGEPEQGIRARLHQWLTSNKAIVMYLDVTDAHEVSRFDLIQKTAVLDFLVVKYEKMGIAYTKLRTLLTALLIRKQSKVLLGALKTFEDAITITEDERARVAGIDTQLQKERKDLTAKETEAKKGIAKQGTTVKKETARKEVEPNE